VREAGMGIAGAADLMADTVLSLKGQHGCRQ